MWESLSSREVLSQSIKEQRQTLDTSRERETAAKGTTQGGREGGREGGKEGMNDQKRINEGKEKKAKQRQRWFRAERERTVR